jgi:hypothetical protein
VRQLIAPSLLVHQWSNNSTAGADILVAAIGHDQ